MSQTLLERLVMPGPLIEGHEKFEGQCTKCHEPFSRRSQTRLCLDCHKDIAADRSTHKGFHGLDKQVGAEPCSRCHSEHKGRAADIVQLDRETFNHDQTNFRLLNAHQHVQCTSCHADKTKFRAAQSTCIACHRKVDRHQGRLGDKCDSCHGTVRWADTKPFDHDKTKFPLKDAHRKVACATCHAGEVYRDLPSTCLSCHRLQDVHADRYGAKCDSCHDQAKWKAVHFDHDKTKYPLRGAHEKVACDTCHTGNLFQDKLATTCVSCHRKDDPHKAKLGDRCEQCHEVRDWRKKVTFDHELSRFPLIGLHASVTCEECHRSPVYRDTPTACEKCHKDYHETRLGPACGACHNPNGWARWRFDHNKTKYPLTGAHQKLICEGCHASKSAPNLKLPSDCFACHRSADPHAGNFGRDCERCHVTTNWKQLQIKN